MDFKYLTSTNGIGGRIKQLPSDFIVEEIGINYETKLTYLPDKKIEDLNWDKVYTDKEALPKKFNYLFVTLEKNNLSTTTAIAQLARYIHLSKNRIGYAGLKDKRAISVQRISIFDPPKERISKFYFRDIKIYDPDWKHKRIDIGDLKQNRFIVTIRQITGFTKEEISSIVGQFIDQVNQNGLINYFGEQRFGGSRDITHEVGKLLLKKNYKDAIILYLTKPSELEYPEVKEARLALAKDLDFGKHAAYFPSDGGYERAMLNYLANNPTDFLGALKVLPKSVQYLFIHAYQSYLFNKLINLRIEKGYTLKPIDGDIINKENGIVQIQLFGFTSKFSEGVAGQMEKELFESEEINFSDFYNEEYSVLSSKGISRDIETKAFDLKLIDIAEDQLNKETIPDSLKLTLSFTLDKGQYATILLRELIKKEFIG
ncbi:MAG: tRNA pseudouridine(13) synthase TruD [archaeon]